MDKIQHFEKYKSVLGYPLPHKLEFPQPIDLQPRGPQARGPIT